MFLAGCIRSLLALPILWLGLLALYFRQAVSIPLLSAAWAVGRDAEVGRTALVATRQFKGLGEALARARAWLERHPRPHFAATAGLLSLQAGRLDDAKAFLARGRELGDDPMGQLDGLEFMIAGISGNGAATARQFEARRDLPADLSKAVLQELMFDDLMNGRFDEAKSRAERFLEVDDYAPAEMVLSALAQRAGDEAEARKHYDLAALPPAQKSYLAFVGCLAIGDRARADEALAKLRGQDEALALRAEGLLKSRESPHDGARDPDPAVPAGPAGGDHSA